jgi:hypothetical protein
MDSQPSAVASVLFVIHVPVYANSVLLTQGEISNGKDNFYE